MERPFVNSDETPVRISSGTLGEKGHFVASPPVACWWYAY